MRNHIVRLAILAAIAFAATPAAACRVYRMADIADIEQADLVVEGRISDYAIIGGAANMISYARFDVLVDDVLKGERREKVAVTWDNSTFGIPEKMVADPVLIALRYPVSETSLHAQTVISANADRGVFTVLQRPCAQAFIFKKDDVQAAAVRQMLRR